MPNFLHATGTSGFIVSPLQLFGAAQLNALASGSGVLSTIVLSQANFAQAQLGLIWLSVVTAGWTPTSGGNITGWWVHSTDGGTTFESQVSTPSTTVPAFPRPPDFIIPVYEGGNTLAAGNIKFASGVFASAVQLPWDSVKAYVQNNSGAAFGAGNHTITCGPVADQY
jgi:hypothetical protein